MSGNNVFLDTNIVLYLLSGDTTIADLLMEQKIFVSFITELELLGYRDISKEDLIKIEEFLKEVTIVDINSEIKKVVVELRKNYKIKLPDAIVAATAFYLNIPLLTSDKELGKLTELQIVLYDK